MKGGDTEIVHNQELMKAVQYLYGSGRITKDQDIAEATGYSKSTISPYLSGKVKAGAPFISKFEDVYKLSLDKFRESSPGDRLPGEHAITINDYIREIRNHNKFLQEIISAGLIDLKTSSTVIQKKIEDLQQQQLVNDVLMMDSLDRLEENPEGTLAEAADNAEDRLKEIREVIRTKKVSGKSSKH